MAVIAASLLERCVGDGGTDGVGVRIPVADDIGDLVGRGGERNGHPAI
jgi:hypothetical protein